MSARAHVIGDPFSVPVLSLSLVGQEASVRMIAVEGEGAKYWPRWRGASGQGLVAGSSYPDPWSATQNVLWKLPVPGDGNSSPIVWGDRIFLTTAHDGGPHLRFALEARQAIRIEGEGFGQDLQRDIAVQLVSRTRYTSPMPPLPMGD